MNRLITYSAIVILGVLAILGWQQANSLGQELVVRDATIANLMVSLKQVQDKPPEIRLIDRLSPYPVEVEKVITKTVYLDRPMPVTKFPEWKIFETIDQFPRVSIAGITPNNCLPMAQALQEMLLKQGYITSVAVAWNGYYDNIYVTGAPGAHAGLLVETKSGWYFVDLDPWRVTKLFGD